MLVLLLVGAPLAGDLLTLSLSRRRELFADAGAFELTGDAAALAEALGRFWWLQGDDWDRLVSSVGGWIWWFR